MEYKNFISTVKNHLQKEVDAGTSITVHQILKNNQTPLDGLAFHNSILEAAPTVYMNDYYEQFQLGRPLKDIEAEILSIYHHNKLNTNFDLSLFGNFDRVKPILAYKLIHYNSNPDLLKLIPHIRFLDLAIVFYLLLDNSPRENITTLVHNQHLHLWNITLEELHAYAKISTPLLLPASIKSMQTILTELALPEHLRKDSDFLQDSELSSDAPLYVLTNQSGIHGACCMLYDNILKNFAQKINANLILLPSSTHEILILPEEPDINISNYAGLVAEVNDTEVSPEDRLSYHIYQYSLEEDIIFLS